MTDEELKELHFENAVEKMLLSNTALLHTILANQKLIMKALNVADEALVDLHDVDGEPGQVAERGVPGPEVVVRESTRAV